MTRSNHQMPLEKFKNHIGIKDAPSKEELELFEKTRAYMKWMSWIPGLRMVAICNSLSMYASDADSDIDLFVVTEKNRMWLVRILMTGIFHILGVRRHGSYVAKRFCLSFFSSVEWLDFSSFRLDHDIYLAYWIYFLKPILDKDGTYELLRKRNEDWTSEFFENSEHQEDERKYLACHCEEQGDAAIQKKPNHLLDRIDSFFRALFLPKTIAHRESLGNPMGIIVNEHMLKFHNNDRREAIKKTLM